MAASITSHRDRRRAGVVAGSLDVIPAAVAITVMGGFGVVVDGVSTAARGWARRHAAALVKVLALAPGHRLHREHAMDLLWPDEPPARCAPRLHKAAHFARRGRRSPGCDRAARRHRVAVPRLRGDRRRNPVRAARQIRNRHERSRRRSGCPRLVPGDLLPGDRYEDWATDRREVLHLRRLDVLRIAGQWRELTELDPTDEEAHVELIRRHLAAGEAAAAIRQYEHLERTLERQLAATPGAAARQARLDADHLDDRREAAKSSESSMPCSPNSPPSSTATAPCSPSSQHSAPHHRRPSR